MNRRLFYYQLDVISGTKLSRLVEMDRS